jgi:6,7-dimethyl-8-ribityllumazine synthase
LEDYETMLTIEGSQKAPGLKFAVVVSKFNDFVTERLQTGALEGLKSAGILGDDICVIKVPGAFEIPFAAKEAATGSNVAAVICLGCLIRGETPHFEYIAQAAAQGIMRAAQRTGVPMTFGVLTTGTADEALARSADGPGNKGREAARAALDMIRLYRQIEGEA